MRARQQGDLSPEAFRAFLRERDRLGGLEMDSASFNHFYLRELQEEFPAARFIFTVRDCYTWFNSFVNMFLRMPQPLPGWPALYLQLIVDAGLMPAFESPESVRAALPKLLEHFLRFWGESNRRILAQLPPERSLIVCTGEISASLDRLAAFVGVPPETLERAKSHRFQGRYGSPDWLWAAERQCIEECVAQHCADVMAQLFPGVTLAAHRARRPTIYLDDATFDALKQGPGR